MNKHAVREFFVSSPLNLNVITCLLCVPAKHTKPHKPQPPPIANCKKKIKKNYKTIINQRQKIKSL